MEKGISPEPAGSDGLVQGRRRPDLGPGLRQLASWAGLRQITWGQEARDPVSQKLGFFTSLCLSFPI